MTKAYIVEDHQIVARLIARFLTERGGIDVMGMAENAETALAELAQIAAGADPLPDILLVDVSLPGRSGIELVAAVQEDFPALPCLMLSGHKETAYARRSLEVGARGYIVKGNPPEILKGVAQVLEGEIYLSEGLIQSEERNG